MDQSVTDAAVRILSGQVRRRVDAGAECWAITVIRMHLSFFQMTLAEGGGCYVLKTSLVEGIGVAPFSYTTPTLVW